MTNELNLILRGEKREEAAKALERALSSDGESVAIEHRPAESLSEETRKVVDPVALAALIVAIPSTALAVWDLADRIKKRKRAEALVEEARQLRIEKRVETYMVTLAGPKALDGMSADQVLELVALLEKSSGK